MKKSAYFVPVLILLALAFGALVAVRKQRHDSQPAVALAVPATPAPAMATPPRPPALLVSPPVASAAVAPVAPASPVRIPEPEPQVEARNAVQNVVFGMRDFRTALGENPVGSNAEITKALLGDNLKQVRIPVPEGSTVNAQGELCDSWGRPYFFHQLSGTQMEVRSAGPDGEMWSQDDLVNK